MKRKLRDLLARLGKMVMPVALTAALSGCATGQPAAGERPPANYHSNPALGGDYVGRGLLKSERPRALDLLNSSVGYESLKSQYEQIGDWAAAPAKQESQLSTSLTRKIDYSAIAAGIKNVSLGDFQQPLAQVNGLSQNSQGERVDSRGEPVSLVDVAGAPQEMVQVVRAARGAFGSDTVAAGAIIDFVVADAKVNAEIASAIADTLPADPENRVDEEAHRRSGNFSGYIIQRTASFDGKSATDSHLSIPSDRQVASWFRSNQTLLRQIETLRVVADLADKVETAPQKPLASVEEAQLLGQWAMDPVWQKMTKVGPGNMLTWAALNARYLETLPVEQRQSNEQMLLLRETSKAAAIQVATIYWEMRSAGAQVADPVFGDSLLRAQQTTDRWDKQRPEWGVRNYREGKEFYRPESPAPWVHRQVPQMDGPGHP